MGLSRQELFSRLQLIRVLEPLAEEAMATRESLAWRGKLGDDSPHGRPWHTSFHASSFPGDQELPCPRKALYTMMDFMKDAPMSPMVRLMAEEGKAIEDVYVEGFYHMGILLSSPPWEDVQLGFTDPEHWMTGNTDAVIVPPQLKRPHVWECKSVYADIIRQMKLGLHGPRDKDLNQAKTYVSYFHDLSPHLWPDLPQLRDGTLFYTSRDNPRETAEFFVEYDPAFKEAGRAHLKKWKDWFDQDILPTQELEEYQHPEKKNSKHPLGVGWRWTYPPCQWCDFGKTCRADHKEGVTTLSKSNGVAFTQTANPKYNWKKIREAVYAAWEDK